MYSEKCVKVAGLYVATLKALYFCYQQCHWNSKGPNFYADHLLFERLYKKTAEEVDSAAEKMIGVFGDQPLDFNFQVEMMNSVLKKYSNNDLIDLCIKMENDFIKFSEQAYECFENEQTLTLGLDDFIMSVSNSHEESCYLLGQVKK
jgi:starvation-inducible DNA-binding protein